MSFYTFWKTAGLELFSRLTSRKLWILIVTCSLPWGALERGVNHLYALSPWQAGVYGGMFAAVLTLIGVAISKYLGVETSYSGSGTFAGALSAAASHAFERREEEIKVDEHRRMEVDEGRARTEGYDLK